MQKTPHRLTRIVAAATERHRFVMACGGAIVAGMAALLVSCPETPPQEAVGGYTDIGGYYIYNFDSGIPPNQDPNTILPTVVFINGLDETLSMWNGVQPGVTAFARTFAYDRGGTGMSDRGPDPRTGTAIVSELHTLLGAANIPPPYILCAHSMGGLFARLYANAYPEEIAGLVLVDTSHEDQSNRRALILSPEDAKKLQDRMSLTALALFKPGDLGEYLNLENTNIAVRTNRLLPDVPLIFLSRGKHEFDFLGVPVNSEEAYELQKVLDEDQVQLVPRGELREVPNSSHLIPQDAPDAVVTAVKDIFDEVTTEAVIEAR